MGKYDPQAERSAAGEHYRRLEPARTPADEAEAGDAAELALLDEMAGKFRARGMGASEAAQYARDALAVWQARDRAVCGAGAVGVAKAAPAVSEERFCWLQAVSQAFAWPDTKAGMWALLAAHGQPPIGLDSMRKMSAERIMSAENVNNMVEEFQRIFGLPRTPLQKSAAAVASYQRTNGAI